MWYINKEKGLGYDWKVYFEKLSENYMISFVSRYVGFK